MNANQYRQFLDRGGWMPLSPRGLWHLRGPDAQRFLNGQITQNVNALESGEALYTCITDAKGRIESDAWVRRWEEGFLVDVPSQLRETAGQRLDRYLIADEVELIDCSESWEVAFGFGEEWESRVRDEMDAPFIFSAQRLGIDGVEVWFPPASREEVEALFPVQTEEALWQWQRIRRGIAQWGSELRAKMLLSEARLEARAVDFHKGCYIGQEVISRIESVGRLKRLLQRVESSENLSPGAVGALPLPLWTAGSECAAGELTSLRYDPLEEKWIGLAYLCTGEEKKNLEARINPHKVVGKFQVVAWEG